MRHHIITSLLIIFMTLTAFGLGITWHLLQNQVVDFSPLENYNPGRPTILLDDQDQEWARFDLDRREPLQYHQFPPCLIQAFLASEDHNFFQHHGISWRGILRSLLVNLRAGRVVQGASTITQQLVKLLFLDARRTFKRKLTEQLVAWLTERQFTKQQILEIYLNHVYFGCGIYGVAAASRRFFNCAVTELRFHEAATLAAVVKSPAQYCPLLCPLSARQRRDAILKQMAHLKFLSPIQLEQELKQELLLAAKPLPGLAPHLKETIRTSLEELVGKTQLYTGGLTVRTTINQRLQQQAEQEFQCQFQMLKKELPAQVDGALLTMETKTGEVKAMVGGYDFSCSQWNRALQARRQMGSIFKPIVYASALQQGAKFSDLAVDEPIEIAFHGQLWRPQNNTKEFAGQMTLARALSYSNNVIAVKTLLQAGIDNVVHLARQFHLPSNSLNPYPSLALGCVDATLCEAVGAFNVFANGGYYVTPHWLKWIKDQWGHKIWKPVLEHKSVLNLAIVAPVTQVLSLGIQRFLRVMHNQVFKIPAIGKTGTTNDSRTCWFVGATPHYTTGIYLGCDNNQSLGQNIYPVWTAFPIWLNLYEKMPQVMTNFAVAPHLQLQQIDWRTGIKVAAEMTGPDIVSIYV